MSKWVRIDSNNIIQEVISYNPFGIVNEAFYPFFHEVSGDVTYGWTYNPEAETFSAPLPPPEEPVGIASTR